MSDCVCSDGAEEAERAALGATAAAVREPTLLTRPTPAACGGPDHKAPLEETEEGHFIFDLTLFLSYLTMQAQRFCEALFTTKTSGLDSMRL